MHHIPVLLGGIVVKRWFYALVSVLVVSIVVVGLTPQVAKAYATRYEIASALVSGLEHHADLSKLSKTDRDLVVRLLIEYWHELDALGFDLEKVLTGIGAAISPKVSPFADVPADHWSYDAIAQLVARGTVAAYHDGSYRAAAGGLGMSFGHPTPNQVPKPTETARYGAYVDNAVKSTLFDPYSTFGLDVSTTSYANVRRFLRAGRLPPVDAVRVEEFINYFPPIAGERTAEPVGSAPFRAAYEIAPCPWNARNALLWFSLTAAELDYREAPDVNLVFLVDVSGSMDPPERLPLAKSALKILVERLRPTDRISLVTYAGSTSVVLEATPGSEKEKILAAIEGLGAGGSTAGAAGLQLAYEQASKGFVRGGVNRVLLCTDGDFNVGVSGTEALKKMIEREREGGVTLSILGFGTGNYNDEMMSAIAGVGNGNYSYIDGMEEARKVLDEEMVSTFVTVAKDAKIQMEFNPAVVSQYRLIGYEKRALANEEFADDTVDAGDVGAGRRVAVLYELTLASGDEEMPQGRYRDFSTATAKNGEVAYLNIRWKKPNGNESAFAGMPIRKDRTAAKFEDAGTGLRFTAAVAAFGQKLRGNGKLHDTTWKQVETWVDEARKDDPYRAEFLRLIQVAAALATPGKELEQVPEK
jgi:Uncharacterized protein containing a von Willebrand factor type A (vWA) domain